MNTSWTLETLSDPHRSLNSLHATRWLRGFWGRWGRCGRCGRCSRLVRRGWRGWRRRALGEGGAVTEPRRPDTVSRERSSSRSASNSQPPSDSSDPSASTMPASSVGTCENWILPPSTLLADCDSIRENPRPKDGVPSASGSEFAPKRLVDASDIFGLAREPHLNYKFLHSRNPTRDH